jgi:hypothetical protein
MNPTNKTTQMRIRVSPDVARRLLALSPRARCRAVSMMVGAAMEGVDLGELLAMRKELSSLGNLLNQSLRASGGAAVDREALRAVVTKLEGVLR